MRPTVEEYFIQMARHVATRATCPRRSVGCVLVGNNSQVLATGFNGVPKGWLHCNEGFEYCTGKHDKAGQRCGECMAVHAELNALLQCSDVNKIVTCYVTDAPCVECTKALLNTSCNRIVYSRPHSKGGIYLWDRLTLQL